MERRSVSSVARQQLLRREEAKFTLQPLVAPVALERKFISMLSPSPDSPVPLEAPSTSSSTDMTSSTSVSTAPSVPPTSATAAPRMTTVSATSTAALARPGAAAVTPTASIVGGKRPLGEGSPVISLVHQQQEEDDQSQASSDFSQSDSSSSQQQARKPQAQEQPHLPQRKPEEATRTLSTYQTTNERGREVDRKRGKPAVQFSDVSPRRDVSHVMKFFQEQEKYLQESFLSLPKPSQKAQRSPSPRLQQAAGLEHLDNLIRLMEQLTSLKDENSRLRKRCDFLESTKILLQAKRDLSLDSSSSSSGVVTLSPQHRHHHHHHHHHHDHPENQDEKDTSPSRVDPLGLLPTSGRLSRPRIASAEELEYLELADASSDQTPKKAKTTMHKRSFSTGSLQVSSEISTEVSGMDARKRKGKSQRRIFGKSSSSKQKSKSSKWARVKKVLTGQKIYEDLGTTIRTIRDLGRSSHISYSSSASHSAMSTSGSRVSASGRMSSAERHPAAAHNIRSAESSIPVAGLTVTTPLLTESVLHRFQEVEDADLTSEIWMGPPGWWEDYQASRETDATSTNSEVSSVIEVTTMYLGSKKETTTTATTTTSTGTAPLTTTTQEAYLTIERPLSRRQSSPSLVMTDPAEEDDIVQELAASLESSRMLHKSASCKSADLDIHSFGEGKQSKKSHRSAWGRVKDIIHTRKDSIKKKPKRGKAGIDSEEPSEGDVDILLEDHWSSDVFDDGLLGRSTPRSSPMVIRQHTAKMASDSLPGAASAGPKISPSRLSGHMSTGSPANVDMATLLAGSVSTEFNKKLQEWEEIRRKKSSFRVSMDESQLVCLDISSVSQQLPETRDLRVRGLQQTTEGVSLDESILPAVEVLGASSINVEEIQRRMTDSFSRKMQEWEKLKYKGASSTAREPSPEGEKKDSKTRKDDRQKSKRSREDKEKEKWERQRERDMQKVEREQVKLEKEKQRIEKERLRTLEREAKLERLKGRLSQIDMEGSMRHSRLGPLAEYKVTADFAQKLHEWELKKGLSHDVSNSIYLEAQKMSMQHLRRGGRMDPQAQQDEARYKPASTSGQPGVDKASPPPPLALQPYWDSPESTSPVEKDSEASLADDDTCTSVTEECLTRSNISSLERANKELLDSLQKKELEYAAVQEQVRKVNQKLATVRESHSTEMARFHRELARGNLSGPVNLQVEELETTVADLEQRIHLMENLGETLASSMESAAIGKWQSIEGEETVHTQLVELVDQMREMLVQASQSEEQTQKTMALCNFETLYTQAMKLQVQMNNLRLSHLERNREIMMIKRQLLLQEVNNLLLQADITRRETELYQFHEAKRFSSLKRWNTFSGAERHRPSNKIEQQSTTAKLGQQQEAGQRPSEPPYINIPYITEKLVLACVVSSSISAPASPLYVTSVGTSPADVASAAAGPALSYPGAARETCTDHMEIHLHLSPSVTTRDHQLWPHDAATVTRQHVIDSMTSCSGHEAKPSLQLPRLVIDSSPIAQPDDKSGALQSEAATAAATTTLLPVSSMSGTTWALASMPTTTTTLGDIRAQRTSTTMYDSVPLHKEIEQLKRQKRKVETGPPTLKRSECEGLSTAPSPVKVPPQLSSIEAPNPTIPKQRSLDTARLIRAAPIVDVDNSLAPSVMECTESLHILELTYPELGAAGGTSLQTQATKNTQHLPPTSDHSKAGSKSPRSPASKHMLRGQREERDATLKDYRAISPQGSPVAARGKPPLPRHVSGVARQSPSSSSASDKGPRSKSVSDMEHRMSDPKMARPLQEVINRFEKRATVCDSDDHPIELRKTPSPTLHLPRVGLVSRVRRLKPAAELLEESQRYRSGHSTYATRILQKYLSKDEHRLDPSRDIHIKEQLPGSYGQDIVPGVSGDTRAAESGDQSTTQTDVQLKGSDFRRAPPEFAGDMAEKPASPSERAALMAVTSGRFGQQVTHLPIGRPSSRPQERTLSDSDIDRQHQAASSTSTKAHNRRSCEVAMVLSASSSPISETSYQIGTLKMADPSAHISQKTGATTTPSSHQSLPAITQRAGGQQLTATEETSRTRAATYCLADVDREKSTRDSKLARTEQPSTLVSARLQQADKGKLSQSIVTHATSTETKHLRDRLSPTPTERRERGKMGTVGILCKQSISFDLGVSMYSQKAEKEESSAKSRHAHSWDPSESVHSGAARGGQQHETTPTLALPPTTSSASPEASEEQRPASTSSEGEMAPSSPTSMEKKRSRGFLHSTWLQKSKQFFKVSK